MSHPILDLESKVARLEADNRELRKALNRTIRLLRHTALATVSTTDDVDPELTTWLSIPWPALNAAEMTRDEDPNHA